MSKIMYTEPAPGESSGFAEAPGPNRPELAAAIMESFAQAIGREILERPSYALDTAHEIAQVAVAWADALLEALQ